MLQQKKKKKWWGLFCSVSRKLGNFSRISITWWQCYSCQQSSSSAASQGICTVIISEYSLWYQKHPTILSYGKPVVFLRLWSIAGMISHLLNAVLCMILSCDFKDSPMSWFNPNWQLLLFMSDVIYSSSQVSVLSGDKAKGGYGFSFLCCCFCRSII